MRFGGRLQAAIEVIEDIEKNHRPAGVALADWGKTHRFAGSGDRAAVGNIVYDTLRTRASTAWCADKDDARSLVLGTMLLEWKEDADKLKEQFAEDKHAPEFLSDKDVKRLQSADLSEAPGWVQANIPEWLQEEFEGNFDEEFINEGRALCARPSTDLRVNSLKADREKVMKALSRFNPVEAPLTKLGVRIPATKGLGKSANVLPEAAYQKGWFEVQDAGSQVVSELVYARPGEQVLDFCAGAGGKTLAMAASMENKGQVHAYDIDRNRLAPIHDRLKRAGTRNVQVHSPGGDDLGKLKGKMDRVVVDAPCTGSGVWRRRPDSKWKLTEDALDQRIEEQTQVLEDAAQYVKKGGYLCYITCSVLAQENEGRIYNFLERYENFELLSVSEVWEDLYGLENIQPWSTDSYSVTLTPATTDTDGFFFAVMARNA